MKKKLKKREPKEDKLQTSVAALTKWSRSYITYVAAVLFAVAALLLALAWYREMAARREAALWAQLQAPSADDLEKLTSEFPSSSVTPWALAKEAALLFDQARYQDVISVCKKIVDQYPSHPVVAGAYLYLGKAYNETNDPERALQAFRAPVLQASYLAPEANWSIALTLETIGDLDAAKPIYEDLSAHRPDQIWGQLASVRLQRLGQDLTPLTPSTSSAEPAVPEAK